MNGVQHGGALDRAIAEFGGNRGDWLDLSTGINPNPYPIPQLPEELWHRLPDEYLMTDCLAAARQYYGVQNNADIVAAPGTQALIQLLPQVSLATKVWIVGPTYNEYERVFAGSLNLSVELELPDAADDVDLVVVGLPNNPDGRVFDFEKIEALGRNLHERDGFVLVDAAFGDVLQENQYLLSALSNADGVMIFRSFGKYFGLAGLRLGFAIGEQIVISRFRTALGPWSVAGPALRVGAIALRDEEWIGNTKNRLTDMRNKIESLLSRNGFEIVGATDLFVTGSNIESRKIANSLAQNCILVRTFDGNPHWIRFGLPANLTEYDRLAKALAQVG